MKKQLLLEKISKDEMIQNLKDYYKYAKAHLDIEESPKVVFVSDQANADDFLGKTGYYDPKTKSIHLFVLDRHPKDIVRSFAHELIHHYQNLHERLPDEVMSKTHDIDYASKDKDLRDMEREAYEKGNMMFRDWTDSIKSKRGKKMNETKMKKNKMLYEQDRRLQPLRVDLEALAMSDYQLVKLLSDAKINADISDEFNEITGIGAEEVQVRDRDKLETLSRQVKSIKPDEFGKGGRGPLEPRKAFTAIVHMYLNKNTEKKFIEFKEEMEDRVKKYYSNDDYKPSEEELKELKKKKSSKGMSYDAAKKAGIDPKKADKRPPDREVSGYEAAVSKAIQKSKARQMEEAQELQKADPRLEKVLTKEERFMDERKTNREQIIYNELMRRILKQGK